MKTKVRKANKKDEKIVERFRSREWYKFNKEQGYSWDQKKYSLIALENKKLIGFAKFKITGGASYLNELIVSKEFRGKGIGNLLIKRFEEFSKNKGCHVVYLETSNKHKTALKFYKKQGYKKVATLKDNKFHFTWYFFEKRLK